MKKSRAKEALFQRWIHSHEEDTDAEMVYRPAAFTFPPARGRTGFELKRDKSVIDIGIGPTDAPQETVGTWATTDEDGPSIRIQFESGRHQVLHVKSVDNHRLVVKKLEKD